MSGQIRYISNPVYESVQDYTYLGDESVQSTILYANKYSNLELVPMVGELRTLFTELQHPTNKFNFRTQLESILEKYDADNGPWYIDGIDGILHIHNRRITQPGFHYRYQDENGEVLEVQVTTNWTTGTSSGTVVSQINENKEVENGKGKVIKLDLPRLEDHQEMGFSYEEKQDNTFVSTNPGSTGRPNGVSNLALVQETSKVLTEQLYYFEDGSIMRIPLERAAELDGQYQEEIDPLIKNGEDLEKGGFQGLSSSQLQSIVNSNTKDQLLKIVADITSNQDMVGDVSEYIDNTINNKKPTQTQIETWKYVCNQIDNQAIVLQDFVKDTTTTQVVSKQLTDENGNEIIYRKRANRLGGTYPVFSKDTTFTGTYSELEKWARKQGISDITEIKDLHEQLIEQEKISAGSAWQTVTADKLKNAKLTFTITTGGYMTLSGELSGLQTMTLPVMDYMNNLTALAKSNSPEARAIAEGRAFWNTLKNRLVKQKHKEIQVQMKVVGRPILQAGQSINIQNIGRKYSGTWNIKTCTHSLTNSSGYICTLILKKYSAGATGGTIITNHGSRDGQISSTATVIETPYTKYTIDQLSTSDQRYLKQESAILDQLQITAKGTGKSEDKLEVSKEQTKIRNFLLMVGKQIQDGTYKNNTYPSQINLKSGQATIYKSVLDDSVREAGDALSNKK